MGRTPRWDSVSLAVGGRFWLHVPKVPNPVSATNVTSNPPQSWPWDTEPDSPKEAPGLAVGVGGSAWESWGEVLEGKERFSWCTGWGHTSRQEDKVQEG